MEKAVLLSLKVGDEVKHKRYGPCKIKDVSQPLFGVVVHIETSEGQALLHADCGANIDDLMVSTPTHSIEK